MILCFNISLALLILLILLLTMTLSFALLATILICQTLLLNLSLLRNNLRINLPKVKNLLIFSKDNTSSICDKYRNGAEFDRNRLLYTMQSLFNTITVIPSLDMILIEPANSTLSGDDSCLHIHVSCYGHKVQGALESNNNYRFSAPDLDIGWDSDLAQYFSVSLSKIFLSTTRLYTLICLFLSLWKKHLVVML